MRTLAADGSLKTVSAAAPRVVVTLAGNYTAVIGDDTILCNGTLTVTLPAVSSNLIGKQYIITNIGTGVVTVDANASELISGQLTQSIVTRYDSMTLECDGSAWYIV